MKTGVLGDNSYIRSVQLNKVSFKVAITGLYHMQKKLCDIMRHLQSPAEEEKINNNQNKINRAFHRRAERPYT